jgi:serine/threonine protein kinase
MTAKDAQTMHGTIGNYDLLERLADGSMGGVFKARHWETSQIVAIKVLSKEVARNPVFLKRFEQEFRVASKLSHPNIVKAIEYCGSGEEPFMVMEYVEGYSLGGKLERVGRLSEEEALPLIVQIGQGLHFAHQQGMIHRDIKPDNILVTADGQAKLTDLGLAKDTNVSAELTRDGRGLGTPNFMAPEQFRNAKNASVRCDVYSLAATTYHLLTGELPFGVTDPVLCMRRKLKNDFPTPRALAPALSEHVDKAIRRAMSADPNQRQVSCLQFIEELTGQSAIPDPVPSDEPSSAAPPSQAADSAAGTVTPTDSGVATVPAPVTASPKGEKASPASAPPATSEPAPHFQLPPAGGSSPEPRGSEWLTNTLIVVLTILATVVGVLYLLPRLLK